MIGLVYKGAGCWFWNKAITEEVKSGAGSIGGAVASKFGLGG